jgi:hypothetical protein
MASPWRLEKVIRVYRHGLEMGWFSVLNMEEWRNGGEAASRIGEWRNGRLGPDGGYSDTGLYECTRVLWAHD